MTLALYYLSVEVPYFADGFIDYDIVNSSYIFDSGNPVPDQSLLEVSRLAHLNRCQPDWSYAGIPTPDSVTGNCTGEGVILASTNLAAVLIESVTDGKSVDFWYGGSQFGIYGTGAPAGLGPIGETLFINQPAQFFYFDTVVPNLAFYYNLKPGVTATISLYVQSYLLYGQLQYAVNQPPPITSWTEYYLPR